MPDEHFRVVAGATLDGVPYIALSGEIDLAATPALHEAWRSLRDGAPPPGLAVALSEVSFLASHCLRWLIDLRSEVGENRLWLVAPSSAVRRLLELSGLGNAFCVVDDLAGLTAEPEPDATLG